MSAEEKRVVSELVGVTGASNDTALQVLRECRGDAQETANRLLDISARPTRAARGVAHAARRAAACRTRHVQACRSACVAWAAHAPRRGRRSVL